MKMKVVYAMVLAFMLSMLVACNSESDDDNSADESNGGADNQEVVAGGEMRVAVHAQPPTIDTHITTATMAPFIMRNVFETLFTQNETFQPTPMLVDSFDLSDDGKTYTFHLREGVQFHNGNEMTADDVVASMNRWIEVTNVGLDGAVFEKVDDYTVEMILEEPKIDTLDILADPSLLAAIMPKDIVENADSTGVTEFIGTGPFKFTEWVQDQHIQLSAFGDYQPVDAPTDGLSGAKEALLDDIYFVFVPDASTRIAGIQSGEYDVITNAPYDNYDQLMAADNVEVITFEYGTQWAVYNKAQGVFADPKMRQAVNAAFDLESVMHAAFANTDFYELDPGYMNNSSENWYSDAGLDAYNQNDPEKAKQLLEEAGYDGELVRILTSRDYDRQYNAAVVMKEQLDAIGMNVELEVFDWPTLTERREDPENWEILTASGPFFATPTKHVLLNPNWAGWTSDPYITESLQELNVAASQEEAKEIWNEIEGFLWDEYLPATILGKFDEIVATTDKVQGFSEFLGGVFWNTSVSE
ncbi:ABC transporter substrate-binding protein [Ornithinibacillus sp. 4-3]|uniref:ABC transporter substrate-binding protein n=1 Tax=Ornithinibacillus sp. 4-3 TaxID=3231488 RepID=A0AB39HMD2_9BACI